MIEARVTCVDKWPHTTETTEASRRLASQEEGTILASRGKQSIFNKLLAKSITVDSVLRREPRVRVVWSLLRALAAHCPLRTKEIVSFVTSSQWVVTVLHYNPLVRASNWETKDLRSEESWIHSLPPQAHSKTSVPLGPTRLCSSDEKTTRGIHFQSVHLCWRRGAPCSQSAPFPFQNGDTSSSQWANWRKNGLCPNHPFYAKRGFSSNMVGTTSSLRIQW